jgi:hypothetical protein
VSSGVDPTGDAPSAVRCLPWWPEEWGDLDGVKERSRHPSAWSKKSVGWPWGSRRMRWRHNWPKVLSPRGGTLAAAETGSARCLTMLHSGRGRRRPAASTRKSGCGRLLLWHGLGTDNLSPRSRCQRGQSECHERRCGRVEGNGRVGVLARRPG